MFEAAVTKFTKAVGGDGCIPVPSLAEADKCKVLNVVIKKNRRWFWQSAKYDPNGFTLQDILRENNVTDSIPKTTKSMDCQSYEKTNKLSVNGKLGGNLKKLLELEASGSDSIDLETKFSKIQKCEIDPQGTLEVIAGK